MIDPFIGVENPIIFGIYHVSLHFKYESESIFVMNIASYR